MPTPNEIGLRIENLVAGAITAGLLILVAVLVGPGLALLGFLTVALILSMLIALGPKPSPQISESRPEVQSRTPFTYR